MVPNLRVPQHILPLTDDQLFELCSSNGELVIERSSNGELIIMSPAGGLTRNRNSRLLNAVFNWNEPRQLGYVFDSSTGFLLPDKSILSPDVSWIGKTRWESLSREKQEKFPPLCPDFVIELRSLSDDFKYISSKIISWISNGCKLAWFIDPQENKTIVYRSDKTIKEVDFQETLSGETILPGFTLSLDKLL
jgi:Uma2 family endonuclease